MHGAGASAGGAGGGAVPEAKEGRLTDTVAPERPAGAPRGVRGGVWQTVPAATYQMFRIPLIGDGTDKLTQDCPSLTAVLWP